MTTPQYAAELLHAQSHQILASPLSPDHLIGTYGLAGLLIIIFAECGLLIGFFLPGDTLLFSAGVLIAVNDPKINTPSLGVLLVTLPIAAILGNIVGYWIGAKAGPAVFDRPRSRLFKPEYVTRSQAFFDRYGAGTILLARFVPIVRTVATVMAGVSRMRYSIYVLFSVIGGIVWTCGVLLLGYWLGHIEFVRKNIEPRIDIILLAVVVLSVLPTLIHLVRSRRRPA
ncbi:VTT domain-containing protein [Jatrophihabitans telluris]|uniref:VTT domain-containing protein n=1 Tax=Jatrophihabitans telluris TaxID=2038343 RepID=A0ABY4QXA0_9ACTN|nr:VTT domain-containing protein [Jatrophihabitans telluris]UQX88316.1 VTT domain-containing protein [Jatrophihabitans telluris]